MVASGEKKDGGTWLTYISTHVGTSWLPVERPMLSDCPGAEMALAKPYG